MTIKDAVQISKKVLRIIENCRIGLKTNDNVKNLLYIGRQTKEKVHFRDY